MCCAGADDLWRMLPGCVKCTLDLHNVQDDPMSRLACTLALALASVHLDAAEAPDAAAVAVYAEQLLEQSYAADGPGAAVLVARGDQLLYRGARGLASVELGVPLSADQVFRIASVTKQFAAAGLLKLVEAGKVALDDPLAKFLPDYPNAAAITVRQLLDHTSGVKSYTGIAGVMDGPIRMDLSTSKLVDSFKDQPVDFAPGARWAYNNSGYVLLGAVIEAASGKPWHLHLQETLLQPAGLVHTRWGADDALIPGMTRGYTVRDGRPAPAAFLSMTQPHAAGALVSTVDDLHRWNLALHGGKLLEAGLYTAMTTPAGAAKEFDYGFGIVRSSLRGRTQLQHGGGIFGYASQLLYLPEDGLSVAVLQNADATVGGKGNPQMLAMRLAAFALGDPYPDPQPIEVDPESLKSYEGVYRIDARSARVLRVVDGRLTSQRTGSGRLVLLPIAPDRFLFDGALTSVTFERDASGAVSGLRFFQDGEGEGVVSARSDEPLPTDRASITLPPESLQRLVGDYLAGGRRMRVFLDGEQLKTQLEGQPAFQLFAESPDRFFLTVVDATLSFAPAEGAVTSVTLHQGPAVIEFKRMD